MTERKGPQTPPHNPDELPGVPASALTSPSAEKQAEQKKADDAARQAHDQRVARGETGAKMTKPAGERPAPDEPHNQPPDSASQSTRAALSGGADEAAARQQMRQAGLGGQFHDDIVDLLPALDSPPQGTLTLNDVIDLVQQHQQAGMDVLKRVYATPKK